MWQNDPPLERWEDVAYGELYERAHLLDVLQPRQHERPLPVTIHFHGGAWRMFGKYLQDCEFMAEAGFCAISANYRYAQEALFPAQLEDAKAVLNWVRAHAEQYGWDAERIGVWGISAGGHLAALLGVRGFEHGVKATACVCAPTDLTRAGDWVLAYQGQGFAELLGAHAAEQPERALRASPTRQISRPSPFLLIHGDEDSEVPLEQSCVLHQALQQAGASSCLQVIPGGNHFINESHRSEVQAALLAFFRMQL